MSHHSADGPPIDPEILERMLVKEREVTKTGATGDHPRGKLVPHDEGGIRIAVGRKGDAVVIDFGTPVTWIGFSPAEARALAESLLKHAGTPPTPAPPTPAPPTPGRADGSGPDQFKPRKFA